MTRVSIFALSVVALLLVGCSSSAPMAPLGFKRHPANSAATISDLTHPLSPLPDSVAPAPTSTPAVPAAAPTSTAAVIILSDYTAPGGIVALPADARRRLVTAARLARTVRLYCRGDRARPSRRYAAELLRRGVAVKRFLVAQGVDARCIHLFVRSGGAFVADNSTPDGRAQNRRVEIHFA